MSTESHTSEFQSLLNFVVILTSLGLVGWLIGWFDSHLNEPEVVFHFVALIGRTILNDSDCLLNVFQKPLICFLRLSGE